MTSRLVGIGSLAVVVSLLSACGPAPTECGADCGNVAGIYAVETTSVSGTCSFVPYQVLPTIELTQSAEGQATTEVLDPVNQVPVSLAGPLYAPSADDQVGTIASFSMYTQTARQATRDDPAMLNLRVIFAGSVASDDTRDGGRVLSGTLNTTAEATGGESCQVNLTFTARD